MQLDKTSLFQYIKSLKKLRRNRKLLFFLIRYKFSIGVVTCLFLVFYFSLPDPLFSDPSSTVLFDEKGELLGARIASDGQWRFPYNEKVPEKFAEALVCFEDKRFWIHPGVDPLAIGRALKLNLARRKIISGGSTLSMQVIRLSRKGKSRTIFEKLIEVCLALRLELKYSKHEILAYYASHAPFGGNVVGLDAAAWKYFGRRAAQLSWAEAATLAVLPNAPSLIHPSKNRELLKIKRDFLLEKLQSKKLIDSLSYELAREEPLPHRPLALPSHAYHLLERFHQDHLKNAQNSFAKKPIQSTLNKKIQIQASEIVKRHAEKLSLKGIHNAAAIVISVEEGDVKAYVGNAIESFPDTDNEYGFAVDIIPSRRSSGSILKPFLYAAMLHEGELLPYSLVPDIPSQFGAYTPKNFDYNYAGAVPAHKALARSLNVPSVRMLSRYGVPRFYRNLKSYGFTSLVYPANHYGLSLILGGAETSLWDLATVYGNLGRSLNDFTYYNGKYSPESFRPLNLLLERSKPRIAFSEQKQLREQNRLSAASIWFTLDAMLAVARPEEERYWQQFASANKIAWKTGTSFGFRDAWAVGCTPKYVVAVWAGNADGEGRPGLIGTQAAAPILFDLFNILDISNQWFIQPYADMEEHWVCKESGFLVSDLCTEKEKQWIPRTGTKTNPCPFHRRVHLDSTQTFRVNSKCYPPQEMVHKSYFVLPPGWEKYYKSRNPDYVTLPPLADFCSENSGTQMMQWIYPRDNTQIYVPKTLDGKLGATVFEVAHRQDNVIIYWHLDEEYVGRTQYIHELSFTPSVGTHTITLVDSYGRRLSKTFEILARE